MIQSPMTDFNCLVTLYHGNDEDGWVKVVEANNEVDLRAAKRRFEQSHSEIFLPYANGYNRFWLNEKCEKIVDYGSHVNFFKIVPNSVI